MESASFRDDARSGRHGAGEYFAQEEFSNVCAAATGRQVLPCFGWTLRGSESRGQRQERPRDGRVQEGHREALMPGRPWLGYFRPHSGSETPAWMRLFIAAVSGAALSFSYTGFYLSIYSWVCVGALLVALFGARPRVAFLCGFLHGVCFVLTSVPWIAEVLAVHGGLSHAGGWGVLLLIAAVWATGNGAVTWAIQRLSLRSITLACVGAPFLWVSLEVYRTWLPEISFPWN